MSVMQRQLSWFRDMRSGVQGTSCTLHSRQNIGREFPAMGMFTLGDCVANEYCYDPAKPAVHGWESRDKPWKYRVAIIYS